MSDGLPAPVSHQHADEFRDACQLLAVLLLICIVWHAVFCVEIVARRRVRLPSSILFFGGKFGAVW